MTMKMKAGFIGFMDYSADPWEQLEQAAKIGYRGTENGEFVLLRGDLSENKSAYDRVGVPYGRNNVGRRLKGTASTA